MNQLLWALADVERYQQFSSDVLQQLSLQDKQVPRDTSFSCANLNLVFHEIIVLRPTGTYLRLCIVVCKN